MMSACMNDPAFMDAFKKNNPGLANKMDELSSDASNSIPASDFLKNLNLSPEQKRKSIKNGAETKEPLAKFDTEFFLSKIDDAAGSKSNKVSNEIGKAVDRSSSNDIKNKFQELTEAIPESKNLISMVNKTPLFDPIVAEVNKNFAVNAAETIPDEVINECFDEIVKNP